MFVTRITKPCTAPAGRYVINARGTTTCHRYAVLDTLGTQLQTFRPYGAIRVTSVDN